jgi:Na+/H+ antiporter NhaD/arsenite permease-like protein
VNTLLIVVFLICYLAIALEHPLRISKSATALFGAGILWTSYITMNGASPETMHQLDDTLTSAAKIIFFLTGAMTIVEVIDAYNGFEIVTARLRATKLTNLLVSISLVTFLLSAILDNLTTTIVMVSLIKRIMNDRKIRLLFAAMIVIAANAGGAWSPMGDVTTTMLWIGGQISALAVVKGLFLASVANLVVPLLVIGISLRGQTFHMRTIEQNAAAPRVSSFDRNLMFFMGTAILALIPIVKIVLHMPVFMGALFGLGILWIVGEVVHWKKTEEEKEPLTLGHALRRIDSSSIIFFLGILLAVGTLEHAGILNLLADWLNHTIGRLDMIVLTLGIVSAVVDNVPLVAASMGMYPLSQHPPDSFLWQFMAYCAGTGGSILIIGSAAGVAAMGLERIEFLWYLKRVGGLALLGYVAGAAVYIAQYNALH